MSDSEAAVAAVKRCLMEARARAGDGGGFLGPFEDGTENPASYPDVLEFEGMLSIPDIARAVIEATQRPDGLRAALDAAHAWIDASDEELRDAGITDTDLLTHARTLREEVDPYESRVGRPFPRPSWAGTLD